MIMLSDVQIAQSTKMDPIKEVASKIGLCEDDLELYGKYKAKISLETMTRLENEKDGKLILVTVTAKGEVKRNKIIEVFKEVKGVIDTVEIA